MKKLILSFTLIIALTSLAAIIAPTSVNLTFQVAVDSTALGGLSLNDYMTNFLVEARYSSDCTLPINQWTVITWPATQFTNQGPPGSDWSIALNATSNPTFFILRTTNFNNGGVSPFTPAVAWVLGGPPGKIKKAQ